MRPGYLTRGSGGRPGGDPVIDYNDRLSFDRHRDPATPEALGSPLQLDPLALLYRSQLFRRDAGHPDNLGVEDPHTILSDGTHPQLRLERHPKLADNDDVKRRVQRRCDFQRDRYPAPREP
jgi:hypothetical protein